MSEQPLSCQLHDYLEIACLYHLEVELVMKDSTRLRGTADTTRTGKDKKEYLVLESVDDKQEVELTRIKKMQAVTANPHFTVIEF